MRGSRWLGVALLVALVAGGTVAVIETRAEGRVASARAVAVRVNGEPVRLGVDARHARDRVGSARESIPTTVCCDPPVRRPCSTRSSTLRSSPSTASASRWTRASTSTRRIVVENGTDATEPIETRTVAIPYPNQDKVALGWLPGAEGAAEEVFGTISGEIVSRRVTREPVAAREQVVPAAVSVGSSVFLTFDDGPDPTWTLRVLDVLRAAGIKATFCMIGRYACAYPDIARRVVAEGHTLCNHTDSHASLDRLSVAGVEAEIQAAGNSIQAATGVRPTLFRFPYGRTSATANAVVARLGLRVLPWNVDPSDYTRPGTDTIITRVAQAVKPGSIILFHDGGGDRSQTVAAITSLINSLRARHAVGIGRHEHCVLRSTSSEGLSARIRSTPGTPAAGQPRPPARPR